ncbi:MAG: DUF1638 domain-containing protein [Xanthomonadales bacterium]|nr:DUF1638 domain-containing protein [Xanthomonadales bacterium]NIX14010.1 DUF1638 domain-containing protein [Xanthomonadales bacterium]
MLIACGALSHELVELQRRNHWDHVRIQCLPAELHNRPGEIPSAVRSLIERNRPEYKHIFVAYADCGTGGALDRVLREFGVERLPGAHCYDFYAGQEVFAGLAEEEPGTFYLTDFLARHFDRLVRRGLGLERHPQLLGEIFGNYRRIVYLAQSDSPELEALARDHARYLGLEFAVQRTGLAPLELVLKEQATAWQS